MIARRSLVVLVVLAVAGLPSSAVAGGECSGLHVTLRGTSGSDVLRGTEDRDVIVALAGDDVVYGYGDGDTLCGGTGNDTLVGGPGDDFLIGQDGADALVGEEGMDQLHPLAGDDEVDGGPSRDTLNFSEASGPIAVDLAMGSATGQGSDVIASVEEVFGSTHATTMIGSDASERFWTLSDDATVRAGAGNDTIFGQSGTGTHVLDGGTGNDDIEAGGEGTDEVSGGPGDDVIEDYGGDVTIDGGEGDDRLLVADGPVAVNGGEGVDLFGFSEYAHGGARVDLAEGIVAGTARGPLTSIENLSGTHFADVLLGDGGPNEIDGRRRPDEIGGRGGDDELVGGADEDSTTGGPGVDRCLATEKTNTCEVAELSDPDDVRGRIDIRSITAARQVLDGRPHVTLTVSTYDYWTPGDLRRGRPDGRIDVLIDSDGDKGADRFVRIDATREGLRARLLTSREKVLRRIEVAKTGRKSVTARLRPGLLGQDVTSYLFWGNSVSNAPGCNERQLSDFTFNYCADSTVAIEHHLVP